MTTSHQTSFLSEIASDDAVIPEGKLAYLQERLRNDLYGFVLRKFLEKEKFGFTKADLARRIGYDPARITKVLGAPGNWTIGTISDLLVGIAAEELTPQSASLLDRIPRNFTKRDLLESPALTYAQESSTAKTGLKTLDHFERTGGALSVCESTLS